MWLIYFTFYAIYLVIHLLRPEKKLKILTTGAFYVKEIDPI